MHVVSGLTVPLHTVINAIAFSSQKIRFSLCSFGSLKL